MKLGVLFSGGKDSVHSAWLMKKEGHKLSCLISIFSKNQDSYMFHTPAIELTKKQAELMKLPILIQETEGEKEIELNDLENVLKKAKEDFQIEGIVSGAIESNYQKERIEKICKKLNLECFSPLWKKNQIEILENLVQEKFRIVISAVAGYPLDKSWIGREIDSKFIEEMKSLRKKYKLNPSGEGGEFESLVLDCPLFSEKLDVKIIEIIGEKNSWRGIFN